MATRKDSRRTGLWPLAYMGVEPVAPPLLLTDNRAPTPNDYRNFNVGTWWINRATAPAEELWILVNKDNNVARWIQFVTGATGIQTLTGDIGGAVGPDGALDIDILGTGPYLFTGTPAAHTLELSDDGTLAYQYDCNTGTAVPIANVLNVLGGNGINTVGVTNNITIAIRGEIANRYVGDVGIATPVANTLNIFGGNLCSTTAGGNTVTIDVDGAVSSSFPTDAGTATPAAGVLNVLGGLNINTAGAGNTVTVNLDDPGQGVVQSDGTGVLSASTGTDGQILIDSTAGGNAAWANITSTGATITVTNGPNTINLEAAAAGGTKVTRFITSGTWTKDPNAQFIKVYIIGSAAGGGSGRRGATTQAGGGGGASAPNFVMSEIIADFAPASAPVVVGAGGAGGVAQTVDNTDGNQGSPGAHTYIGQLYNDYFSSGTPVGGYGGVNGTSGWGGRGYLFLFPRMGAPAAGQNHAGGQGSNGPGGGDAVNAGSQWMTFYGSTGGGGGGTGDSGSESPGGAGGGLTTADLNTMFLTGATGGTESVAIDGANGLDATATNAFLSTGGLGGGGGGGQHVGPVAGNGGDGGAPGGGGGGGGGSLNGTNSGAGGSGARGEVIIIESLG